LLIPEKTREYRSHSIKYVSHVYVSLKMQYATSRGVYGTPFFYVNGFLLPDTGDAIDYKAWRKVIDPLVGTKKSIQNTDSLHFFL